MPPLTIFKIPSTHTVECSFYYPLIYMAYSRGYICRSEFLVYVVFTILFVAVCSVFSSIHEIAIIIIKITSIACKSEQSRLFGYQMVTVRSPRTHTRVSCVERILNDNKTTSNHVQIYFCDCLCFECITSDKL